MSTPEDPNKTSLNNAKVQTQSPPQNIKLTQTVTKGGCAAKVSASELRNILSQVKFPARPPELLIDSEYFDDAGVYLIDEKLALVQTLDFFTPIVDDPYLFGQIAAANALSDVYAMGGVPKTAMGILCMPVSLLPAEMIVALMQGASDKIAEAKACLVGGHSIDDDTLKFGLSVTGFVNPQKIWSNAKAQAGDLLILTKALGTGTATAALKRQEVNEAGILTVTQSMTQLNSILDLISVDEAQGIHAATDITGFGLAGHAMQMSHASDMSFQIDMTKIPVFENTWPLLEKGFLTKAHRSNAQYTESASRFDNISDLKKLILFDPQTSGGLLLSVAPEWAPEVCQKLQRRFKSAAIIGQVSRSEGSRLSFRDSGT